MIDIHCHILHGLDDGAKNMDESVEMARIAWLDGVHHIFATPHFTEKHHNVSAIVKKKVSQLQEKLDLEQIPVNIYPGCELRLCNPAFVRESIERQEAALLGPSGKFLLLEQRWKDYETKTPEVIEWIKNRGIQPILAHPERHFFFRDDPEQLNELIDLGIWTQVSVDSLLGKNGPEALEFSKHLLQQDHIHTLATDSHNTRRKPNLSEGFRKVEEWGSKKQADDIRERLNRILA